MRWHAMVPGDGTDAAFGTLGRTVTVAAQHLVAWWSDTAREWSRTPPPGPRTGIVRQVVYGVDGSFSIICDDTTPRRCPRCGADVVEELWVPDQDDHKVMIEGPLTVDAVATRPDGAHVTYRVEQPYIIVNCSEVDRTLTALRPEVENSRYRNPRSV